MILGLLASHQTLLGLLLGHAKECSNAVSALLRTGVDREGAPAKPDQSE
jgi:hypothetical protein